MKNAFILGVLGTFMFSVGLAFAHAPTVTLDPIGDLEYASLPQVYDVTGVVEHSNPGNASAVNDITLFINDIQEGLPVNPNVGNDPSVLFSIPWNITAPGLYTVKVVARHGNSFGEDTEDLTVTETELPPIIIDECPAAPSYAAHYLKSLGLKPNKKSVRNVISLTAHHMGPQTDFDGIGACDRAAYEAAVHAFVDANMNVSK